MKTVLYAALILILWTSKSYGQQPDWIINRPNSSLHYIGIASAEKNNTNYQKIAKRNALDDLLSEIRVTIQSVSILNQMDNNGVFKEEYQSIIKSTVADEIENLELVATYEDETHYHVYYRILKEEYANQKQRNKEQAQKMALQFFEKAKGAESTKDYVTAIDFYLQSLLAIKAYWGENIEVTYQGKSMFLAIESYTQLQKLLDGINITSDTQTINFNSRTETKTLVIQAKDNGNNTISKIPLLVSFLPQRAQQKNYFTNENGQASVTLGLTNNVDFNQVEVIFNLKNFSKGSSDDRYYQYLMQSLRCPTQKIDIVIPDQLAINTTRVDGDLFPFNLDYVNIDFSNESTYTYQNLRLIPIRATENFKVMVGSMGFYISLQEAIDGNLVAISEVSNSGTVNTLLVRNLSNDTLFVMSGEILIGGKQDRVIARDMLIPPNSGQVKIPVFCVEEGRWNYKGAGAKFTEYYGMANEHLRNLIDHNASQATIWREVSSSNKKDAINSNTSAYTAHADNQEFRRREAEYLRFFENIFNGQDDIIGVLAVTGNSIEGADLFVSNRLFTMEYRKLLYSYIDDAITYGAPVNVEKVTIDNYLTQLLTPQLQQSFVQEKGQAFRRGNQLIHIAVY
ncbi:MAG: ARPP-1 family domain-containing protein [Flavobacteriales bacterium]